MWLLVIVFSNIAQAQVSSSNTVKLTLEEVGFRIPKSTKQLIFVKAASDTSRMAELLLLKRSKVEWIAESLGHWVLGRNGLAEGCDSFSSSVNLPKNCKAEGDGKTPKGLFKIGKAFGYSEKPKQLKLPYLMADSLLYCIDDVSFAKGYNKIIRKKSGQPTTWASAEEMKRKDICYQLGLEIKYNAQGTPGRGSCIFIHIRKPGFHYTAGCVAGTREQVEKLLFSLKKKFKPMVWIDII